MKKIIIFLLLVIALFLYPKSTKAFDSGSCKEISISSDTVTEIFTNSQKIKYEFSVQSTGTFEVTIVGSSPARGQNWSRYEISDVAQKIAGSFGRAYSANVFEEGSHTIEVKRPPGASGYYCRFPYTVLAALTPTPHPGYQYPNCIIELDSNSDPITGKKYTPDVDIFVRVHDGNTLNVGHRVFIKERGCEINEIGVNLPTVTTSWQTLKKCQIGSHNVILQRDWQWGDPRAEIGHWVDTACTSSFNITSEGIVPPTPTPTPDPACDGYPVDERCDPDQHPECQTHHSCITPVPTGPPGIDAKDICEQISAGCDKIKDPDAQNRCKEDATKCLDCFAQGRAWTALGCIKTDVGGFVRDLFRIILGVVGGIAFLLLLKGGFQVMFSRGDAEEIAEGQQTITAAVFGLIFIFLAVFILKIIGVDILDLPGFGPD